jgi:hypothetical protein
LCVEFHATLSGRHGYDYSLCTLTPVSYVVAGRKHGDTWYIAGINGTNDKKSISLDLSFIPGNAKGTLITDGAERTFSQTTLEKTALRKATIEMQPRGGFVIVAKP